MYPRDCAVPTAEGLIGGMTSRRSRYEVDGQSPSLREDWMEGEDAEPCDAPPPLHPSLQRQDSRHGSTSGAGEYLGRCCRLGRSFGGLRTIDGRCCLLRREGLNYEAAKVECGCSQDNLKLVQYCGTRSEDAGSRLHNSVKFGLRS